MKTIQAHVCESVAFVELSAKAGPEHSTPGPVDRAVKAVSSFARRLWLKVKVGVPK